MSTHNIKKEDWVKVWWFFDCQRATDVTRYRCSLDDSDFGLRRMLGDSIITRNGALLSCFEICILFHFIFVLGFPFLCCGHAFVHVSIIFILPSNVAAQRNLWLCGVSGYPNCDWLWPSLAPHLLFVLNAFVKKTLLHHTQWTPDMQFLKVVRYKLYGDWPLSDSDTPINRRLTVMDRNGTLPLLKVAITAKCERTQMRS